MTDTEILQNIASAKQANNNTNKLLSELMEDLADTSKANISYIAMMADIELPSDEEDEEEEETDNV